MQTKQYKDRFLPPVAAAGRGTVDDMIIPHPTRRCYRGAALRGLLTALVIAVAAPMLAGCTTPPAGVMYLPVPPLDVCRGMTSNPNKDCGESNFAYDPSTGELFLICNAGQAITLLAGGKANCGRSAELTFTKEYSAWLATQGIATPGVSDPVLTHTPTD